MMICFTPTQINMLGFKINAIDNSSVVNSGSLQNVDIFLNYKRNQAVGEINGDLCPLNVPISSVVDPDLADNTAAKNSVV